MDDPGVSQIYGQIILIAVLTLINAFLAGAEMAFVSVNHGKIAELAEEGDARAKKVMALLSSSDLFLSTIQVGITFAGFLSSASAANTFVGYLVPYLKNIPAGHTIATAIVTLILSYISLVFGELFPKQIAIQFPEKYCLFSASTITVLRIFFYPFVKLLTLSTNVLKHLVPIDFTQREEHLTRQEMRALIESGRNDGVIDVDEFKMMQGVLSLDTKLAREVMTPRTDAFMLDEEADHDENLLSILEAPYSRIPVFKDDKDDILGIIHAKDVLREAERVGFSQINFTDIIKPAFFVPETIFIDDLLLQFKRNKQHMAILKDEYGGVVGLVTLEDLIEEIVGDIEDEYDEVAFKYSKLEEGHYIIEGNLPIDQFNQLFGTSVESDESDTIAGYVIEILGHFPSDHVEEKVRVEDYLLTTIAVENGRIRQLEVVNSPEETQDTNSEIQKVD